MDGSYVELEAQAAARQRALRAEASSERLARAARAGGPRAVPARRARSLLAAALVAVAGWLDDRYADRGVVPGRWVRIA